MVPFMRNIQNKQRHIDRKQINIDSGVGQEGNEEDLLKGQDFLFWVDKYPAISSCEAVKLCEISEATELYAF